MKITPEDILMYGFSIFFIIGILCIACCFVSMAIDIIKMKSE